MSFTVYKVTRQFSGLDSALKPYILHTSVACGSMDISRAVRYRLGQQVCPEIKDSKLFAFDTLQAARIVAIRRDYRVSVWECETESTPMPYANVEILLPYAWADVCNYVGRNIGCLSKEYAVAVRKSSLCERTVTPKGTVLVDDLKLIRELIREL